MIFSGCLTALYCSSLYYHKELINIKKNGAFVCDLIENFKLSLCSRGNNRIQYILNFITCRLTKMHVSLSG